MKLSAAIRIGSMKTRQIKHQLNDGKNGRCALGAAYDAVGLFDNKKVSFSSVCNMFPIITKNVPLPTSISNRLYLLGSTIIYLNDSLNWSREEIANWVETLENALEAKEVKQEEKVLVNK